MTPELAGIMAQVANGVHPHVLTPHAQPVPAGGFGTPTTLDVLIDAVEAQLIAAGVVPSSTQILPATLRDDDELFFNPPDPNNYIMIYPLDFPANLPAKAGGLNQYDGKLRISLWRYIGLDWTPLQHAVLKAATYQEIAQWTQVLAALEQFVPLDTDGNKVVCEPMRNIHWKPDTSRPDRLGRVKFVGEWSMKFVQKLS